MKLVIVSIDGEKNAIPLGLKGVTQSGELSIVGVLDESIFDELGKEAGLDRVESGVVDEGTGKIECNDWHRSSAPRVKGRATVNQLTSSAA